jgi:cell division protein FtsZ
VARIAREKKVALTVGIVTIPFQFEGTQKIQKALEGIEEMSKHVDALFVINNQRLTEIYSDLDYANAFIKADESLAIVVGSIVYYRFFNDVEYTLHKGGQAMVFSGYAAGERRVTKALENAFESPLLKDCDKYGFKKILMSFLYNPDSESPLLMEDMNEVEEFLINLAQDAICICYLDCDRTLDNRIKVTVLASGFNTTYG